jgi:hypothetical protein
MRVAVLAAFSMFFGASAVCADDFDPYNKNGPPIKCSGGNVAAFDSGSWKCFTPSPQMTRPNPAPLYGESKSTGGSSGPAKTVSK